MTQGNKLKTETSDREIITARVFDAPRELVWEVWTDPKHIAEWWGPIGFTNTIHKMDVTPGGEWNFIMHGPDGVDYKTKIIYEEIVKPELIVYSHVSWPLFRATITFEEQKGKTKLTMHTVFESAAEYEKVVKQNNAIEGAKQTLGRLAEYLTKIDKIKQ